MQNCNRYIQQIYALQKELDKYRFDQLTGVYTRTYLDQAIKEIYMPKFEMNSSWNYNVYLIDLNNLHQINRDQGYFAGDQYIIKSIGYIKSVFNSTNSNYDIYRIGGDEFVIISDPSDKVDLNDLKHENYTIASSKWTKDTTFKEVITQLDSTIISHKNSRAKYTIYVDDDDLYNTIQELIRQHNNDKLLNYIRENTINQDNELT